MRNVTAAGGFLTIVFWLFFVICWIVNLVQLINCDFEAPYKKEVIKAIGVCTGVSFVTVWINPKEKGA
jgi:hypothetical protein